MSDDIMPPPMFDLELVEVVPVKRYDYTPTPEHQVKGYLWTTHNKFKGVVWLDYSALNVRNCPSAKQAAEHAFSRAVMNKTLGAEAKDLAGHILFVPVTPWGGPVMVK